MLGKHLFMTILRAACCLLAAFVYVPGAARADDGMHLGYGKERTVTFLPVTDRGTGGSALYFPAATMQMYKGCSITELHVGINEPSGYDSVRVFITRSLDEAPLYEQRYTARRAGWNTVTLDTPFQLDGSALYIGYEVTGQYYLHYSEVFIDGEEWINQGDGRWSEYTGIYSASLYAVVTGGSLPRNNIRLGHVSMPGYAVAGESLLCKGEFVNLGLDDVESLTLSYYIDGEHACDENVDVTPTAGRTSGDFQGKALSFSSPGDRKVSISVTAVNGSDDADPSDNTLEARSVKCVDRFVRRNVLFEVFSTELCTACPGTHEVIAATLEGKPGIIEIGHHAGFYTDGLTIPASKEYEWFYGDGRLYAPAMMFDRTCFTANLPDYYAEGSPVTGINSEHLVNVYNEAMGVPAFVEVNVEPRLDAGNRRLGLTVSGRRLLPLADADKLRLFVFLTEDSIYSDSQAGAAEGFYHRYVARHSFTPTWGEYVDVEGGFSVDYETDIPVEWNIGMLRAVAFVAYYDADDICHCEVLNSAEVRLAADGTAGVDAVDAGGGENVVTYDSGNIVVPGGCGAVSLFDASGRCVMYNPAGGTMTPVGHLPHGIYVVKVVTGGGVKTVKIKL